MQMIKKKLFLLEEREQSKIILLKLKTQEAIKRFPHLFDDSFMDGLNRLIANTSKSFVATRTFKHLFRILCVQYFLQKKLELLIREKISHRDHFLKIFSAPPILCIALLTSLSCEEEYFGRERLLNALQGFLPGIKEIPFSFYSWMHPEKPYFFCYLEIQKLRGKELSSSKIREIEKFLQEQITHSMHPRTPMIFSPINEEDSYRLLFALQKEITKPKEMPQVAISFYKQTPSQLHFLIHLVRPKSPDPLYLKTRHFPNSILSSLHLFHLYKKPFPIEAWVFDLTISAHLFYEDNSINLLYARRFIAKYVEKLVGPFRDYNGGLFEQQQRQFETLEMHLLQKIPLFSLFAKKVFYSLRPLEKRLSLVLTDAEILLSTLSTLMRETSSFFQIVRPSSNILIIKTLDFSSISYELLALKEHLTHGQITLSGVHYFYILGVDNNDLDTFENLFTHSHAPSTKEILHLAYQSGEPPSLNPYHASREMVGRIVSKMLYEGLVRINQEGKPALAGAKAIHISDDLCIYTFELKEHYWSNGERVSAFNYKNSWLCALLDDCHTNSPEHLFIIKNARLFREGGCSEKELGIQATNAETLRVELEYPDPSFLSKLAQPLFFPFFGKLHEPTWFNGPYLVQKKEDNRLLLESNPFFWNHQSISLKQICIEWKDFHISKLHTAFQEGSNDWVGEPFSSLSPEIMQSLEKQKILKFQKTSRFCWLIFNTQQFSLNSKWIRKALSQVIDRSFICNSIFPHDFPLYSFFEDVSDIRDTTDAKILFDKGLKELGLTLQTFPRLTLRHSHETGRLELAKYLQKIWQETFGITIHLEEIEWNVLRRYLDNGEFHITFCIGSFISNDPIEILERFDKLKTSNSSKWIHSRYQEIIYSTTKPRNKYNKELLKEAVEILQDEVPFAPICSHTHLYAHTSKLTGYFFDHTGCVDFHLAHFEQ